MTDPTSQPSTAGRLSATTTLAGAAAVIVFANVVLCGSAAGPLLSLVMLAWNVAPLALAAWTSRRFVATRRARLVAGATLTAMLLVEAAFLAATTAQVLVQFHGWTIPGVRPESLYGLVPLLIPIPVGGIGLLGLAAALLVQRRERARISVAR